MSDELYNSIPIGALDRPIAFHPVFRKVGGSTVAGIFLSQMWYWTRRLPEDRGGWLYKTKQEWEEETGLSRREQERARRDLKASGILEEERRGIDPTIRFRIDITQLATLIRTSFNQEGRGGDDGTSGDAQTVHQVMSKPAITRSPNRTSLHTESTSETTAQKDEKRRSDFESFWSRYPRKTDKDTAWRAWKKLDPSPELQETILAALNKQIANTWHGKDKSFIPHGSTWLNRKRWEDEIIPPENGIPTPIRQEAAHSGQRQHPPGLFGQEILDWYKNNPEGDDE